MPIEAIIKVIVNFKAISFIEEYYFLINFKVFNQSYSSFN